MKMNGAEEQSGLCEGERERGHFGELNSWLMAGSGDYMRGFNPGRFRVRRVVVRNAGSDLIGLSGGRDEARMGVSGASTELPLFLGLPLSACALHVPRTPLDRTHSSILSLSPPSLISFASAELLAS